MRVYIGHDRREQSSFDLAAKTAREFGCEVVPLYEERLRLSGMLTRPLDRRVQMYDLNSAAPQATDFAIARFFVPLLAHSGWALFADCDCLFLEDPHELLHIADPTKAVMVVKHDELSVTSVKMDDQPQSWYPRKLWSSVCMWNADHPANQRLNLTSLNQWPGRDLHAFKWLADNEIGELEPRWNWLVGMTEKPDRPAIGHWTLGTPDLIGFDKAPHSDIWAARQ